MPKKLKTETNTPAMGRRIMATAARFQWSVPHHSFSVDFEHGQWWVTCKDYGAQWSVADQEGGGDIDGFGLERVSDGDGYCEERS